MNGSTGRYMRLNVRCKRRTMSRPPFGLLSAASICPSGGNSPPTPRNHPILYTAAGRTNRYYAGPRLGIVRLGTYPAAHSPPSTVSVTARGHRRETGSRTTGSGCKYQSQKGLKMDRCKRCGRKLGWVYFSSGYCTLLCEYKHKREMAQPHAVRNFLITMAIVFAIVIILARM